MIGVSTSIVDSPNLGFPYFNFFKNLLYMHLYNIWSFSHQVLQFQIEGQDDDDDIIEGGCGGGVWAVSGGQWYLGVMVAKGNGAKLISWCDTIHLL